MPPAAARHPRRKSSAEARRAAFSPDVLAKRQASRRAADHDAELVRQFLRGNQGAFDEMVARYREKLFSVALSMLRNRTDAEEIVQDTFIRAFRGLKNFRGDSSLVTWLHRITVNLARNRYWYFHRRRRHATLSLDCPLSEAGDATFGEVFASPAANPQREATTNEFVDLVTVCMDQLQPGHREILTLRNVLNHSYDEIAETLGLEVGTVKSRIARARGCLRTLMAESCPEFKPEAGPAEWLDLTEEQMTPGASRAGAA